MSDRQTAYRRALELIGQLQVVRRQQPDNPDALGPKTGEFKKSVASLCSGYTVLDAPSPPIPQTESAEQSRVGPPKGPVTPSVAPSRPEDVEARRRATEEVFLPAGPAEIQAKISPQLFPLSDEQMRTVCADLERQIGELDRAMADPADTARLDQLLGQMQAYLLRLGTPRSE